jgi:uncharacterized membrane protein (DUF4010 family)
LAYCLYLIKKDPADEKADVTFVNPFELWPAITFAFLFTLILLLSKAAQMYLGVEGVYFTSFISGLADVDAITLSIAQLSKVQGGIDLVQAGRAILLAAVANTFLKGLLVVGMSGPALRRSVAPGFLLMIGTALLVVFII